MAILLPREKNASRNGGKASAAKAASQDSATTPYKSRDIDAPHITKAKQGEGKQEARRELSLIHI